MDETNQTLPAQFGSFYLYDAIGRGGMAEIFLAKTFTGLGTERLAAIKRILPAFGDDESFGDMLIQEAKLCARLSHANIVQTYDLGKTEGQFYIAMEYVEGFDLNRLLGMVSRARLALPFQFAIYIVIETLRGLDYAHRMSNEEGELLGIIHRDVSPTNVLISTEGEVKLCDFGIAKVVMSDYGQDHLDEYHLRGKVAYMAPEHLEGEALDCRADLYAAGILLWELLSGRRLFKSKDEKETFAKAKEAVVEPLRDRGFPEYEMINAIVMKALSRDPDRRFQTGQEFIRALGEYMHLAGLIVSQLKFSEFLMEHFGENLLEMRRERERNLAGLYQFEKDHQTSLEEEPSEIRARDSRAEAIIAAFAAFDDSEEAAAKMALGDGNGGEKSASTSRKDASPVDRSRETPESESAPNGTDGEEPASQRLPSPKEIPSVREPSGNTSQRSTSQVEKKKFAGVLWIVLALLALAAMVIAVYFSLTIAT